MIRVLPSLLLLTACASAPEVCPEPSVTALICPAPMADYYDEMFRGELAAEVDSLPDNSAVKKAAQSYLAVAKKCGTT